MGSNPTKHLPEHKLDNINTILRVEGIYNAKVFQPHKKQSRKEDAPILQRNKKYFIKTVFKKSHRDAERLADKLRVVTRSKSAAKRKKIILLKDSVILVSKLYDYDLHHAMYSSNVSAQHLEQYLFSVLKEVHRLHNKMMAHTDIKPSNILCHKKKLRVKICDLENAYVHSMRDDFVYRGGTLFYRPSSQKLREIMRRPHSMLTKMKILDVYAIGVIIKQCLNTVTTNKLFWRELAHHYTVTSLLPNRPIHLLDDAVTFANFRSVLM